MTTMVLCALGARLEIQGSRHVRGRAAPDLVHANALGGRAALVIA